MSYGPLHSMFTLVISESAIMFVFTMIEYKATGNVL